MNFFLLLTCIFVQIPLSSNSSEKLVHLIDENPALRLLIDSKNAPEAVSLYALLQVKFTRRKPNQHKSFLF